MKDISFSPMNAMIKGTAFAIDKVLRECGLPAYTLAPSSTYSQDQVNEADAGIKQANVIFEMFNDVYMTTQQMPLGKVSQVKFLILADGGTESRSDGSYAIYKDFGENSPSVAWHFEPYTGPHMEEFDGEEDMLEAVWSSFLDHEWQYEFEDFSSGEMTLYAYKGKKAKEMIEKWKDDSHFLVDDAGVEAAVREVAKAIVPAKVTQTPVDSMTVFITAEDYRTLAETAQWEKASLVCKASESAWKLNVEIIDEPVRYELSANNTAVCFSQLRREQTGIYSKDKAAKWPVEKGALQTNSKAGNSKPELMDVTALLMLKDLLEGSGIRDQLSKLDSDRSGVILRNNSGNFDSQIVQTWQRPLLCCKHPDGQTTLERPYSDEISISLLLPYMSMEEIISKAEQGYPSCMYDLAMKYYYADDASNSAFWMERLAQTGDASAQFNIAEFYADGYGVPRDLDKAIIWMRKAREQGEPESEEALQRYEALKDMTHGDSSVKGDGSI